MEGIITSLMQKVSWHWSTFHSKNKFKPLCNSSTSNLGLFWHRVCTITKHIVYTSSNPGPIWQVVRYAKKPWTYMLLGHLLNCLRNKTSNKLLNDSIRLNSRNIIYTGMWVASDSIYNLIFKVYSINIAVK